MFMLTIEDLQMHYPLDCGVHHALRGVSFDVQPGEFFTLLGPSGCGKTTTLRSVAGLETPTVGRIVIDGDTVVDARRGIATPPNNRDISMVFQSYAIWPHMSVAENVAFPLRATGRAGPGMAGKVKAALEMFWLGAYLERPATQLSGGQQQRVALARAIVKDAKLLLLDEPLSNLDAKLRESMRHELAELQHRLGTTTLYVTHDQEEALSMSDRIAVMSEGEMVELGTPEALYLRPRHGFTARFIGQAQLFECTSIGKAGDGFAVETPLGRLIAGVNADFGSRATHVFIRPEHAVLAPRGQADVTGEMPNRLTGTVIDADFAGKLVEYRVRLGNGELQVQQLSTSLVGPGDEVTVTLPPERCALLSES